MKSLSEFQLRISIYKLGLRDTTRDTTFLYFFNKHICFLDIEYKSSALINTFYFFVKVWRSIIEQLVETFRVTVESERNPVKTPAYYSKEFKHPLVNC